MLTIAVILGITVAKELEIPTGRSERTAIFRWAAYVAMTVSDAYSE